MNVLCHDGEAFRGNFPTRVDFHCYAACGWLLTTDTITNDLRTEAAPFVSADVGVGEGRDEPKGRLR